MHRPVSSADVVLEFTAAGWRLVHDPALVTAIRQLEAIETISEELNRGYRAAATRRRFYVGVQQDEVA